MHLNFMDWCYIRLANIISISSHIAPQTYLFPETSPSRPIGEDLGADDTYTKDIMLITIKSTSL